MNYDISKLFSIETNEGFHWSELRRPLESEGTAILSVVKEYGIQGCERLWSIEKRNKLSRLYRLQTEGLDYLFRQVSEAEAGLVEEQCRVAHEVDYPRMIKPDLNKQGSYVTVADGYAWISYIYHKGELFSGEKEGLFDIVKECLKLIHDLKSLNGKHQLFHVQHHPHEWPSRLHNFLDLERYNQSLYGPLLSEEMQALLSENKKEIENLVEKLSKIDLEDDAALTHNDLNHANILMQKDSPFFLDLEDICFENVKIAIVHCLFKLLRHTVYTGHAEPEEARERLLPSALRSRGLDDFGICNLEQFYVLGQYRILSDINSILKQISRNTRTGAASDLEKKFMNLFELDFLAKGN